MIYIVAEHGKNAILWTLIEENPGNVNLFNISGRTPLSYAAANGYILTVDHFWKNGGFADTANIGKPHLMGRRLCNNRGPFYSPGPNLFVVLVVYKMVV